MAGEVVEGEVDEPAHRLERRERGELQLLLGPAHLDVDALERREIEALLAAEVVVDQPQVRARVLADALHPAAAIALLGKFEDRRAQDALARRQRMAVARLARAAR